ncbi:hypothetical protein BRYFOR_09091 [Marvinbryantia formatexigens DSM 14469]|uniref:YARHG domain-containing protein n=1 Tax=Marvinbryantia formatexigens DSM 14469 TaxID=478749 RepID=C6LKA4_9FIRM|nr:YARHG domain-containing protein [Marvinbryantia formatexigens]EET58985.1 hypothetical protein BRYFOR_09091 [Marvinbryantia formatexigens DSM 14469]UWO23410.1 YARHG domain-containing protein [Marvinbryantia formatexigens DSM 14469]SDH26444.1 YARHG domain-containing protein [Marvinbryantia formatexigens]
MKWAKEKLFLLIFFVLIVVGMPVVHAQDVTSETIEKAYMEFLHESVSPGAYYAIENLGVDQMPVLLIGKEGQTEENGEILFTACDIYYYTGGQVTGGGSVAGLSVPLRIARKEGQDYIQSSHNAHSKCFTFLKESGLYYYEYDSNEALEAGVTQEENGEFYACGERFGEYISEYADMGPVCFRKNTDSDFDSIAFYQTWVQEHMEKTLGICETGTFTRTMPGAMPGWCEQSGIITSYCADFNDNGREECLVIYLQEESNGKMLHLTALSVDEAGEVRQQDIRIVGIDINLGNDTRIYVTKGKAGGDIIVQNFHTLNGCADNIYIFEITSDGAFFLKSWILDPGESPGIILCSKWALEEGAGMLCDAEWEGWQTTLLYENDATADCAEDSAYGDCLNEALGVYDLHASVSETMFGRSMWLLDEKEKMLKLAQIYGKFGSDAGEYRYDYGIFNYTDLKDGAGNESSDEILPDSDIRYLSDSEILDMSLQVLNYAKNEIYARKGRRSRSVELQQYFDSKSWYRGTIEPGDFDEGVLNAYEQKNVQMLSSREHEINPEGYRTDQMGYSFDVVNDYIAAKQEDSE